MLIPRSDSPGRPGPFSTKNGPPPMRSRRALARSAYGTNPARRRRTARALGGIAIRPMNPSPLIRVHSSLSAGRFEEGHDLFHLIWVVEHPPGGPEAFLPPDAEMTTVGGGKLAAHLVQFVLFGGA